MILFVLLACGDGACFSVDLMLSSVHLFVFTNDFCNTNVQVLNLEDLVTRSRGPNTVLALGSRRRIHFRQHIILGVWDTFIITLPSPTAIFLCLVFFKLLGVTAAMFVVEIYPVSPAQPV